MKIRANSRSVRLCALLAIATGLILSAPMASADIMRACTAEIGAHCSGVAKGRGRIAACLYAHSAEISGACADEVAALASSSSVALFVPASVTNLKGTEYESALRAACIGDADMLCRGVNKNDDRVLACLYARERQLSGSCKSTGERVLRELR